MQLVDDIVARQKDSAHDRLHGSWVPDGDIDETTFFCDGAAVTASDGDEDIVRTDLGRGCELVSAPFLSREAMVADEECEVA